MGDPLRVGGCDATTANGLVSAGPAPPPSVAPNGFQATLPDKDIDRSRKFGDWGIGFGLGVFPRANSV
jgi:hypothetical protein